MMPIGSSLHYNIPMVNHVCALSIAVLLSLARGGAQYSRTCYKCNGQDNVSKCYRIPADAAQFQETCTSIPGRLLVCMKEIQEVCKATVHKDATDAAGNGGGRLKIWKSYGCAHVDKTEDSYRRHKKCYWTRERGGRDLVHETGGFQVVGRSVVTRRCYCSKDLCNADTEETRCGCGPACGQASRDQCETPGYEGDEPEPFSEDCACPAMANDTGDGGRAWPECGRDPDLWVARKVGSKTYRHPGEEDGGREDGAVAPQGQACAVALVVSFARLVLCC